MLTLFRRFIVCWVSMLQLLTGCAANHPPSVAITSPTVESLKPVTVYLAIEDRQSYSVSFGVDSSVGHSTMASTGDPLADIVAHALAEVIIQNTQKKTIQRTDPLLNFTRSLDFAMAYRDRFINTLSSIEGVNVKNVQLSQGLINQDQRSEIIATLDANAGLFAEVDYFFSPDYRKLYVRTQLELWEDASAKKPAFRGRYVFCSAQNGESDAMDIETTLDGWSEANSKRLRRALHQGIEESMRMVRVGMQPDFKGSGSVSGQAEDHNLCAPFIDSGEIMSQHAYRWIVRSEDGILYSVLDPNIGFKAHEAHLQTTFSASAIPLKKAQQTGVVKTVK